jgi:hypothetical protein
MAPVAGQQYLRPSLNVLEHHACLPHQCLQGVSVLESRPGVKPML